MRIEDIRIRRAKTSDLPQILAIEKESFPTPWSKEAFLKEFEKKNGVFLVIEEASEILGYVCFWVIADEMHLANLAVRRDCRQKGLGKKLLEVALETAKRYGAKRALLEVREGNLAALRLYQSLGFKFEGRRPRYYSDTGEDAILMGLSLT